MSRLNAVRVDDPDDGRASEPPHRREQEPLVPSRRQYLDLKQQHPGAILLYRLGDFYETFDDDAHVLARDARVTLTSRSFGRSGRSPMAGVPHHALNHYLGKLLAAGHTVAIAEQISPPGRGLVERAVTRVLTPGTVSDPALLPAGENRFLAAMHRLGERWGLAWVDVSTGEFAVAEFCRRRRRGAIGRRGRPSQSGRDARPRRLPRPAGREDHARSSDPIGLVALAPRAGG